MKVEVIGGITCNVWDSTEELELRQNSAKELARRRRLDAQWTNRLVMLAQSISGTHWQLVKRLSDGKLKEVIEQMMRTGFPGDVPYKDHPIYLKQQIVESNNVVH